MRPAVNIVIEKRLKIKFIALFIIFLIAACGLAFGGGLYLAYRNLPQVESLREYRPSLVTRIYSDDNKIVGEYFIEKGCWSLIKPFLYI